MAIKKYVLSFEFLLYLLQQGSRVDHLITKGIDPDAEFLNVEFEKKRKELIVTVNETGDSYNAYGMFFPQFELINIKTEPAIDPQSIDEARPWKFPKTEDQFGEFLDRMRPDDQAMLYNLLNRRGHRVQSWYVESWTRSHKKKP